MEYEWQHLYSILRILKLMRSFIQITDTTNDILRSLPLGDLSSNSTYFFRVWNNLPQADGIAALNGLKLNILYPPKQGIKTLINQDAIQIRCTYSGKYSEDVSSSFQSFPINGDDYNRLEPHCYNEYEVQIDFSNLSTAQKTNVEQIEMEFNIVATYDIEYVPLSLPSVRAIYSDSYIANLPIVSIPSNTYINWIFIIDTIDSDSTISLTSEILNTSDTSILNALTVIYALSNTAIYREGFNTITPLSDTAVYRAAFNTLVKITDTKIIGVLQKQLESDTLMKAVYEITKLSNERIVGVDFGGVFNILTDTRMKVVDNEIQTDSDSWILYSFETTPTVSDTRIKVLGVIPARLQIESFTKIAAP